MWQERTLQGFSFVLANNFYFILFPKECMFYFSVQRWIGLQKEKGVIQHSALKLQPNPLNSIPGRGGLVKDNYNRKGISWGAFHFHEEWMIAMKFFIFMKVIQKLTPKFYSREGILLTIMKSFFFHVGWMVLGCTSLQRINEELGNW
jgi:hypothetical protein